MRDNISSDGGNSADDVKKSAFSAESVEFDFETAVFDSDSVLDATDTSESAEMSGNGETGESQSKAKPVGVNDEEFDIPDTVGFSDAFPATDYVSTIWRPYVPRFTEITENQYHFADNSAVKAKLAEDEAKLSGEGGGSSAITGSGSAPLKAGPNIRVEKVEGTTGISSSERTYPTAEIVSTVPDAVVVNVNGSRNSKKDTINVFKFPEEKVESPTEKVDGEELERREISDLTGHKWDEKKETESSVPPASNTDFKDEEESSEHEFSADAFSSETPSAVQEDAVFPEDYDYLPNGYDPADTPKNANDTSEYNSFSMRETFKDRFLDTIMSVRIRLIVAVVLGVFTLAFEMFPLHIAAFFGLGTVDNAVMFIDCALIVGMLLISLPEIIRGFRILMSGAISSEFTSVIAALGIFSYTLYITLVSADEYILLGSVYAVSVINSIVATNYLNIASFSAFKVISERGKKSIIDCKMTRNLETHNHALDGVVDEYKSKCAKVFDALFVGGFFRNSKKNRENTRNNIITLSVVFGVAIVLAIALYFIADLTQAFAGFALVIALAFPAQSLLSHKLPYSYAQSEAASRGSAFIGEEALYDCSGVDVLVFEDTEVFGHDDVTVKSASDKRSNYHESMRKMSSLFNAVGGPLSVVFESMLNKKFAPATNVTVEDDGVIGYVDSKRLMAGTADFMRRHDISIPNQSVLKIGSTRVIYAAEEGEFFATFTVNYSFSEEFALMLSAMREKGIVPLVYTRDFNIDNEFMRGLTGGCDVIRVMKKFDTEKQRSVLKRVNATAITTEDKTATLENILCAKKYTQLQSWISVIEVSASGVGAVLAVAIALCRMTFALPIILLVLWQIGWGIVLAIMGKRNFTTRKKERNDATE